MTNLKSAIRRLFYRIGYDIRGLKHANTEQTAAKSLLGQTKPVAVLDVGANIGQYVDMIRELGFKGKVVSFEATEEAHSVLAARAKRTSNWIAAPLGALGAEKGSIEINIAGNLVSSSLLDMKPLHVQAAPESAYVGRQRVKIERLDVVAPDLIPPSGDLYLKIDTQGYEREVLKGSLGLLPRVTALQLELSIAALYDKAPSLVEMLDYSAQLGYELFNLVPGYKDVNSGRVYQLEGFFIRKTDES